MQDTIISLLTHDTIQSHLFEVAGTALTALLASSLVKRIQRKLAAPEIKQIADLGESLYRAAKDGVITGEEVDNLYMQGKRLVIKGYVNDEYKIQ